MGWWDFRKQWFRTSDWWMASIEFQPPNTSTVWKFGQRRSSIDYGPREGHLRPTQLALPVTVRWSPSPTSSRSVRALRAPAMQGTIPYWGWLRRFWDGKWDIQRRGSLESLPSKGQESLTYAHGMVNSILYVIECDVAVVSDNMDHDWVHQFKTNKYNITDIHRWQNNPRQDSGQMEAIATALSSTLGDAISLETWSSWKK